MEMSAIGTPSKRLSVRVMRSNLSSRGTNAHCTCSIACNRCESSSGRGATSMTKRFRALFPFDGGGRLAAYVICDAIDAPDFVDDAAGHFFQQRVRQFRPVRGHEVTGLHCPKRHHVIV